MINIIIGAAVGIAVGGIAGFLTGKAPSKKLQEELTDLRSSFDKRLDNERDRITKDADERVKSTVKKQRQVIEDESKEERDANRREAKRLEQLDKTLSDREGGLDRREQKFDNKFDQLTKREDKLNDTEAQLEKLQAHLDSTQTNLAARESELEQKLSQIAELSRDEAREQLFSKLDNELAAEQSQLISRRVKEAEEQGKEQANEILARAIQRYAAEHTADSTTSKVELANDDLKGRIIGKEGRNIRSFEQSTGVDLIIDDTPNIITISCFDGVRREIARRALVELLEDGRIHPVRIEEVLRRVRQDLDREVVKMGEEAAYECDVSGLHPQLLKLLGKLNFRTSYGQNVLQHSKEVCFLTGAMASDMGMDPKLARRCGLLHDIGKPWTMNKKAATPCWVTKPVSASAKMTSYKTRRSRTTKATKSPRCTPPSPLRPMPFQPLAPVPAAKTSNATSSAWLNWKTSPAITVA